MYFTKITFPHGAVIEVLSKDQEGGDPAILSQQAAETVLSAWKDDENSGGRFIADFTLESYGPRGQRGVDDEDKREMFCLTKTTRKDGTEFHGWPSFEEDSYYLGHIPEAAFKVEFESKQRTEAKV